MVQPLTATPARIGLVKPFKVKKVYHYFEAFLKKSGYALGMYI